jgi:hypothetical protein
MKLFLTVTDTAMLRNFGIVSDKFSVTSPCRLKNLIESWRQSSSQSFFLFVDTSDVENMTYRYTGRKISASLSYVRERGRVDRKGKGGVRCLARNPFPCLPVPPLAGHQRVYLGFEVLTAVSTKMVVFWVVAPCGLVEVYQRFRGPCCLHPR